MVFGVIPCANILSILEACPRRIKGAGHAVPGSTVGCDAQQRQVAWELACQA